MMKGIFVYYNKINVWGMGHPMKYKTVDFP